MEFLDLIDMFSPVILTGVVNVRNRSKGEEAVGIQVCPGYLGRSVLLVQNGCVRSGMAGKQLSIHGLLALDDNAAGGHVSVGDGCIGVSAGRDAAARTGIRWRPCAVRRRFSHGVSGTAGQACDLPGFAIFNIYGGSAGSEIDGFGPILCTVFEDSGTEFTSDRLPALGQGNEHLEAVAGLGAGCHCLGDPQFARVQRVGDSDRSVGATDGLRGGIGGHIIIYRRLCDGIGHLHTLLAFGQVVPGIAGVPGIGERIRAPVCGHDN